MVLPEVSAQNQELLRTQHARTLQERKGFAISWDGTNRLGAVLRERRTHLGLTLSQVAERVGCAKSYLSEIETGVRARPPGPELLARLESALGLEASSRRDSSGAGTGVELGSESESSSSRV